MQICIENNSKIEDIQKLFTAGYPYLKIEFYRLSTFNKKDSLPLNMYLAHAASNSSTSTINIKETTTVAELEDDFLKLGVKAEIFRKSGNVWVETILTSNWTLNQQNLEGEEITRHYTTG